VPEVAITVSIPDTCGTCGARLEPGNAAWWNGEELHSSCARCRETPGLRPGARPWHEPDLRRRGVPQRLEEAAEHAVAVVADRAVAGVGHCLHHRRHPRSRGVLDHLAVVPGGVVVIDTRRDHGQVHLRAGRQLRVGASDRTRLLRTLERHCEAVRWLLDDLGHPHVPVHGVLCLVGVTWPERRGGRVGAHEVVSPAALVGVVRRDGPITEAERAAVAIALSVALPGASTVR
jgi:hypothetical protein